MRCWEVRYRSRFLRILKFCIPGSSLYSWLWLPCCVKSPKLKSFGGSVEKGVLGSTCESYRGGQGTWKTAAEVTSILGKESPRPGEGTPEWPPYGISALKWQLASSPKAGAYAKWSVQNGDEFLLKWGWSRLVEGLVERLLWAGTFGVPMGLAGLGSNDLFISGSS